MRRELPQLDVQQNLYALRIEPDFFRQIQETVYVSPQVYLSEGSAPQVRMLERLEEIDASLKDEHVDAWSEKLFFETLGITPSNWLNFCEVFCAEYPHLVFAIEAVAIKIASLLIQKDLRETTEGLDDDPATLRAATFLRPMLVVRQEGQAFGINYGSFFHNDGHDVCPDSGWFRIRDGRQLYDMLQASLRANLETDIDGACIDVETMSTSTGDNYIFAVSAGKNQVVPEQEPVDVSATVFTSLDVPVKLNWQYLGEEPIEWLSLREEQTLSFITPKVVQDGRELEFLLTATDAYGNQVQDLVTLTVNNTINELPEVALHSPTYVRSGQPFHINVSIVDENPDDTFTQTWNFLEFPDWQPDHVEADNISLMARFIPPHVDTKTKVTVQLSLQDNAMREAGIERPVQADIIILPNTLPTLETNVPDEVLYGREFVATAWANDPDHGDTVNFSWQIIDHPEIQARVIEERQGFSKVALRSPYVTEQTQIQVEVGVQDRALMASDEFVTQAQTVTVLPNSLPELSIYTDDYSYTGNHWVRVTARVNDDNDDDTISFDWEITAYDGDKYARDHELTNPVPLSYEVQTQDKSRCYIWFKTPPVVEGEVKTVKIRARVQDDYLRETGQYVVREEAIGVENDDFMRPWAQQIGDFYEATRGTGGEHVRSSFEFRNPAASVETLIEELSADDENPDIYQAVFLIDESGSMYPVTDMLAAEASRVIDKIVEEAGEDGQIQVALYGYSDSKTRTYLDMTEVISVNDTERLTQIKEQLSKAAERASKEIRNGEHSQETIWRTIGNLLTGSSGFGIGAPDAISWGDFENPVRRFIVLTDFELNSEENIVDSWTPAKASQTMQKAGVEFWPIQYAIPWGC